MSCSIDAILADVGLVAFANWLEAPSHGGWPVLSGLGLVAVSLLASPLISGGTRTPADRA